MQTFVLWILCSLVLGALALPADKDQAPNNDGGSSASKKDGVVAVKKRSPLMMPGMGGLGSMGDLGGLGGGGLGGLSGGGLGGGGISGLGGGLGGLGGGMPNLLSMASPSSSSTSSGADTSPLSGLMGMGGLSGIGNLGNAGKFASSLSTTPDTTSPSPNDPPASSSTPGCPPLYLIFARGTAEIQGTFGIVGRPLCTGLQQAIPGTLCYDTVYTSDAEYMVSPGIGANTASRFIASIAAKCPTTKYALAGYSKGAMVVHQIRAKNVVAAVTFGDPLKMQAVQSTNDVKTFCNLGDPVCENGMMIMAHMTYSMQDIPQAVQFIVQAFKSSGTATRRKRHPRRKHASHGAGP